MPAGSRLHFFKKMEITFLNNRGPEIQGQMSHRLSVFTKVSIIIALDVKCPPAYLSPGLHGQTGSCVKWTERGLSERSGVGKQAGVRAHLTSECVIVSRNTSCVFVREEEKSM